jgi:hypothetical protein
MRIHERRSRGPKELQSKERTTLARREGIGTYVCQERKKPWR